MIVDTSVNPLEINIAFKDFANIYRASVKYKDEKSIVRLIGIMRHAFSSWEEAWVTLDYSKNINIASLINLLKADNKPVAPIDWKIDTYNKYLAVAGLSITDELIFCLMQHIQKKKKFVQKRYKRPKKLLFFIAKDIKMFLFKKIRGVVSRYRTYNNYLTPLPEKTITYDEVIDNVFLMQNILYRNFLLLYSQGLNETEIREILFLTRPQYKELFLWLSQNLKLLNK